MQSSRGLGPDDLDRPIRSVLPSLSRGAAALARLGITTPREALWYFPFRYDDFSDLRSLRELLPDEKQSARVRVEAVRVEPGFGRKPQRVIAQLSDDDGGSAEAIWFGRRYVERRLQVGDELVMSGKVSIRGWRPQFTSPEFSAVGRESVHTARVVPVYLDPNEPVLLDRHPHQLLDPSLVGLRMDEGETPEAVRMGGNDPGHLSVGDRVVGMEGREEDRAADTGSRGAHQIPVERGPGIRRSSEAVTGARVAVAVDDHVDIPARGANFSCAGPGSPRRRWSGRRAKSEMAVAIPPSKLGR
jgi:hypothetical protein